MSEMVTPTPDVHETPLLKLPQQRKPRAPRQRQWGSIRRVPRREGGLYPGWVARWPIGGGRTRQSPLGLQMTKTQAEEFLAARRAELVADRIAGVPSVRPMTVAQFTPQVLAHYADCGAPSARHQREWIYGHFTEALGHRRLVSLTRDDVAAYLAQQTAQHAWGIATRHTVKQRLSAYFTLARERGLVRSHPVRGVRLPPIPEKVIRHLTTEEQLALCEGLPDERMRDCARVIRELGLRRNEAVFMEWVEVRRDLSAFVLPAARAKHRRGRAVPLTPAAREILERRRAAREGEEPRVFPGVGRSEFNAAFSRLARSKGYRKYEVTPHTLRHAFGCRLAEAGVHAEVIRRLMGHASIAVTQIYFRGLAGDAESRAIERLVAAEGGQA